MSRYQLIIFDWDGTVMDSVPKIVNTMQLAAKELALPIPQAQSVKDIIGLSLETAAEVLFGDKADTQLIAQTYKSVYRERDITPAPLFEGVEDVFKHLRAQGYQLAIATGKSRKGLNRLLAEHQLVDYFCATRTACESESKPHPDMLHQILQQTGVHPTDAIMVGDTIIDMTLAKNAGVDGLAVTFGVHSEAQMQALAPKAFVHQFSAIPAVIAQLTE